VKGAFVPEKDANWPVNAEGVILMNSSPFFT